MPPIIDVHGIRMAYGAREALCGIDLAVEEGEVMGLLGPNGGGKSTLFRILATLLLPSAGQATIAGRDVVLDPHGVRRAISVVFQSPSLDRKLTVEENLRHQGHLYGLRGHALSSAMRDMLGRVGLEDRAADLVETLSGGMKRRAEIAKALLHHPRVLLLDEPTTGLDPAVRREVWDHLRVLREREGTTILVTTHGMDEAERCDRVAILHRGALVALGTPAALRREVGGDVIHVRAADAAGLRDRLAAALSVQPQVVDGVVRLESEEAPRLLGEILTRFSGEVLGVSLDRPTLEDVFVHRTGKTFEAAEHEEAA